MGHAIIWKILEEIVIELHKKDVAIPEKVMTDLRSAKTMIGLANVIDKDKGEMAPRLEQCLADVEAYLITEAEKTFPQERLDEWLQRLNQAACNACISEPQTKQETRFVSGVPRDQEWMRVEPIADLPMKKLKALADETGLSYKPNNDHLVVYGEAAQIREFVKKMTEQTQKTAEKQS